MWPANLYTLDSAVTRGWEPTLFTLLIGTVLSAGQHLRVHLPHFRQRGLPVVWLSLETSTPPTAPQDNDKGSRLEPFIAPQEGGGRSKAPRNRSAGWPVAGTAGWRRQAIGAAGPVTMTTAVAKGESQWRRRQGRFKNLKQTERSIAGGGAGKGQGVGDLGQAEPYGTGTPRGRD